MKQSSRLLAVDLVRRNLHQFEPDFLLTIWLSSCASYAWVFWLSSFATWLSFSSIWVDVENKKVKSNSKEEEQQEREQVAIAMCGQRVLRTPSLTWVDRQWRRDGQPYRSQTLEGQPCFDLKICRNEACSEITCMRLRLLFCERRRDIHIRKVSALKTSTGGPLTYLLIMSTIRRSSQLWT